jgi:hypothetical protein
MPIIALIAVALSVLPIKARAAGYPVLATGRYAVEVQVSSAVPINDGYCLNTAGALYAGIVYLDRRSSSLTIRLFLPQGAGSGEFGQSKQTMQLAAEGYRNDAWTGTLKWTLTANGEQFKDLPVTFSLVIGHDFPDDQSWNGNINEQQPQGCSVTYAFAGILIGP